MNNYHLFLQDTTPGVAHSIPTQDKPVLLTIKAGRMPFYSINRLNILLQTIHTMRLISYKIKMYYKYLIKNVIASEQTFLDPQSRDKPLLIL